VSCDATVKAALQSVERCEDAKADWEKGWTWANYGSEEDVAG
jgi:hypothetical protein